MADHLDPAIGLIEFDSVAIGLIAGDAAVKAAPLGSIYAGSVHPGRYLVLVSGDTASVEVAVEVGRSIGAAVLVDSMLLADIHPDVAAAVADGGTSAVAEGEAVAIVETASVAAIIDAADAGIKAARVDLAALRLADGLGGKGYLVFGGALAEVEAARDAAVARAEPGGQLLHSVVVAQLHPEMRHNLAADLRFRRRVAMRPVERG